MRKEVLQDLYVSIKCVLRGQMYSRFTGYCRRRIYYMCLATEWQYTCEFVSWQTSRALYGYFGEFLFFGGSILLLFYSVGTMASCNYNGGTI